MAYKNYSKFVCLLVVALAVDWANGDLPEKLLGATDTTIDQYPFIVSLRDAGEHFCGGAILNRTHIVTAGHCVEPIIDGEIKMRTLTIWSGTDSLKRGGTRHTAARLSLHPKFVHNSIFVKYDIGLIELSKPIILNKVQQVVPLPTRDYTISEPNMSVTVVAWGDTSYPKGQTSINLQKLKVKVVKRDICKRHFKGPASQDFFCTYLAESAGTCVGDSGSPIMYKGVLVGLVSHGIPCAVGIPDMQTNVFHMLDYIRGIKM